MSSGSGLRTQQNSLPFTRIWAARFADPSVQHRWKWVTELWRRGPLQRALIVVVAGFGLGSYTVGIALAPQSLAPLFAVAILAPFVGMIVGNLRRLLLAAAVLNIPFGLGTHLGYRVEAANLGAFGGLSISLTTLAVVILYGLWLGDWLVRLDHRPRLSVRPAIPLIAYVFFVGLSVSVAQDRALAFYELFFLVQMLLLFIYVASVIRSRDDVLFVTSLLLAGLVLESLVIGWTRFSGQDFSFGGISTRTDPGGLLGGGPARAGGTIGSPNGAAGYLSFALPPAIGLLLADVGRGYRLLATIALISGSIALLLTQSRGGWLAFALAATICCIYAWRRRWLSATVPILIAAAVGVLLYVFRDALLARLIQDDQGAAESRVPLMKLAFDVIRDNPIFGIGANNFALIISDYATPEFSRDWLYTVHNKYLLVWSEAGLPALVSFVAFLSVSLWRGIGVLRSTDSLLGPLALGFTAALAGQMTHMFFDIFNGRPLVQQLWLVSALLAAMLAILRLEERPA